MENYNRLKPVGVREESHPFCLEREACREKKCNRRRFTVVKRESYQGWQELHRQCCDKAQSGRGSRCVKKVNKKLGASKIWCSFSYRDSFATYPKSQNILFCLEMWAQGWLCLTHGFMAASLEGLGRVASASITSSSGFWITWKGKLKINPNPPITAMKSTVLVSTWEQCRWSRAGWVGELWGPYWWLWNVVPMWEKIYKLRAHYQGKKDL